jgi:hypothetical protein
MVGSEEAMGIGAIGSLRFCRSHVAHRGASAPDGHRGKRDAPESLELRSVTDQRSSAMLW